MYVFSDRGKWDNSCHPSNKRLYEEQYFLFKHNVTIFLREMFVLGVIQTTNQLKHYFILTHVS